MKENKMALKRALNEYRGKKDYERLLRNYLQLESECEMAIKNRNALGEMLDAIEAQNKSLKASVVVIFNLLLVALIACLWLWFRG